MYMLVNSACSASKVAFFHIVVPVLVLYGDNDLPVINCNEPLID